MFHPEKWSLKWNAEHFPRFEVVWPFEEADELFCFVLCSRIRKYSVASHEEVQNKEKPSDENYPWGDQVSWSKKQFILEHVQVKLYIKTGIEVLLN